MICTFCFAYDAFEDESYSSPGSPVGLLFSVKKVVLSHQKIFTKRKIVIQLALKVTTDVTAEMKADQFISHFHKK